LYLPEGGRALLVDSNGAGLDGKVRYSACLDLEAEAGRRSWRSRMILTT
jgi:hypothetical protein